MLCYFLSVSERKTRIKFVAKTNTVEERYRLLHRKMRNHCLDVFAGKKLLISNIFQEFTNGNY